jgi:hypothetical protein
LKLTSCFNQITNKFLAIQHDIPIISQKNAQNHSKEAPSMNFTSTNKIFAPTWCVWSDVRRGWQAQAPLAVTFRFHVPVGDLLIFVLLSGDASRVGIGFHWACRLISLAWHAIRPSISNLIHNALRVRTWRDGCL